MRNRHRSIKKLVLFLLLLSTAVVFAYGRREAFFQQAKKLIKQKLERRFSPAELSIGKIKAGLFYGLVLKEVKIKFSHFNVEIAEALVNYNLWQNVFGLGKEAADGSRQRGELVCTLDGGKIFLGEAPLLKDLEGKLLLGQKGLTFEEISGSFKGGPRQALKLHGEATEEALTLTANLERSSFGSLDVLTNLNLTLDKKLNLYDDSAKTCGRLTTYGSVLNKQPFPELNASFEIQDGKLRILTCSLGDSYDLRGIIGLSAPYEANLSLNFNQAAPHEFISRLGPLSKGARAQLGVGGQPDFSGLVNGLIKASGPLKRPRIEGCLEVMEGHIGDLDFASADINIKGRYPRLFVVDSRICREDGFFIMEGEMDFSNLAGQKVLDIKFKSDKGMLWQGWDITRNSDNDVHASKSIAEDVKVTFDSFMEGTRDNLENDYTNELGLECRIFGDKLLRLRLRKEEEILGVERKIRF
ncbi:MAG: hypothetical protein JSV30_06420 [Candidatus Omnitrophota bacterium]|nr:MAG: hypothetical protein JSV30_06420 [Candidatus Omnitrophota bacterium]